MRDKTFEIASDPKYNGYPRGVDSLFYKSFAKISSGSNVAKVPNYQLSNELYRQTIRKFKRRKVYSSFRGNIYGVDFADMQS